MLHNNSTALDYFQKIIDFVYDPQYARHLRKIAVQYDRLVIPDSIDIKPFIIDNLIFDVYIDNQTLLDHFIAKAKPILSKKQLGIYQQFRQSYLSCFKVIATSPDGSFVLEDFVDASAYTVIDEEAIKFLRRDTIAIARLLPFEEHYVLTGSCAIVNTDERPKILALTRKLKIPPLFFNTQ